MQGNKEILSFQVGMQTYGVDVLKVKEIRGFQPASPIPDAPAYFLGVISLRGDVVPVVDLRIRFGTPEAAYLATTVTVLLMEEWQGKHLLLGLVVDSVNEVVPLSDCRVKSLPPMDQNVRANYLSGVASSPAGDVLLLDVARLFNLNELTLASQILD